MWRLTVITLLALLSMAADDPSYVRKVGSVSGAVKDQEGYELPGVTVTLVPKDCTCNFTATPCCLRTRIAVTGVHGEYNFLNVAPGDYEIASDLMGLKIARTKITVKPEAPTTGNFSMEWAAAEVITVTSDSPVVTIAGIESGQPVVFQNTGCKCSTKCPGDPLCSCCPSGIAVQTSGKGIATATLPAGEYEVIVPKRGQVPLFRSLTLKPGTKTAIDVKTFIEKMNEPRVN